MGIHSRQRDNSNNNNNNNNNINTTITTTMINFLFTLVSFYAAVVYPMYASMKAIERKRPDDDTLWLTYWIVYISVLMSESIGVVFWIPKYRFVKLCLIYYLISPRFKGAVTLYKSGIAPIFRKLSPSIDKTGDLIMKGDFQALHKELGPQLKELQSFVQKDGPEAVNRLFSKVKQTKVGAGSSSGADTAKES